MHNPKLRPICLLSELGKLLERILAHRIEDWMWKNSQYNLTDMQYGFRKARSTCDALQYVKEYVQNATGCGDIVIATRFDISNAFNSIKWKHIRAAIKERSFPVYMRRMINDYLSNRSVEFPTSDGDTYVQSRQVSLRAQSWAPPCGTWFMIVS